VAVLEYLDTSIMTKKRYSSKQEKTLIVFESVSRMKPSKVFTVSRFHNRSGNLEAGMIAHPQLHSRLLQEKWQQHLGGIYTVMKPNFSGF